VTSEEKYPRAEYKIARKRWRGGDGAKKIFLRLCDDSCLHRAANRRQCCTLSEK
jgi:hypothetical protein